MQTTATIESLATLFSSKARATVLKLFMLDPHRAYYQRQIETATGLPIRAVQRELARLTKVGLLYRHAEGNRAYYQVDTQFPLFKGLRSLVLTCSDAEDRVRGELAMDEEVRLAFYNSVESRLLVVAAGSSAPALALPEDIRVDFMTSDQFLAALAEKSSVLEPFLVKGVDLLGRRDDLIWRRIEAAGYTVAKGKGIG